MKAKIEPKRWQNIINSAMIDGLIDPFRLKVGTKGLLALNLTEAETTMSAVIVDPAYFLEFNVEDDEELTFGKEVSDRMKWGFKKDELEISTEEDNMVISDGTDKLPVELDEKIERQVPVPLTKTKYGPMPDFNLYNELKELKEKKRPDDWSEDLCFEGYNIYKTDSSNLKFPGKVTNYRLVFDGKDISVSIKGTSTKFEHTVEGEAKKGEQTTILVGSDQFDNIVNNLEGEVYLIFNDRVLIFLEGHHEHIKKAFSLATKEE